MMQRRLGHIHRHIRNSIATNVAIRAGQLVDLIVRPKAAVARGNGPKGGRPRKRPGADASLEQVH
jgi:hypothetical protein